MGAIVGDVLGSIYEHAGAKEKSVQLLHSRMRPTDDSVLTLAVARAICDATVRAPKSGGDGGTAPSAADYAESLRRFGSLYPDAGYGGHFRRWIMHPEMGAYNSWGNGSAMRVSPVAWAFTSEGRVLAQAKRTALPTHNHPEGVKGAQAVALSIWLARRGADRQAIREANERRFGYDMSRSTDAIRPTYTFEISCMASVPEAIIAFLDSVDFEDAIRNAISLGGDADTQACISGAIAEAFYGGVPEHLLAFVLARLDAFQLETAGAFAHRYLPLTTARAVQAERESRDQG